eukprot:TRINITY_DN12811_c0_g1_i1.p1 TRINITY_DN12811_c0_g1~~TRINITY_DN12811_c0_g1_i1.p1  ORF type:complete len:633 (+),score=132.90 TRINITY_DN12811_c0_g1_i1:329-2227(+)
MKEMRMVALLSKHSNRSRQLEQKLAELQQKYNQETVIHEDEKATLEAEVLRLGNVLQVYVKKLAAVPDASLGSTAPKDGWSESEATLSTRLRDLNKKRTADAVLIAKLQASLQAREVATRAAEAKVEELQVALQVERERADAVKPTLAVARGLRGLRRSRVSASMAAEQSPTTEPEPEALVTPVLRVNTTEPSVSLTPRLRSAATPATPTASAGAGGWSVVRRRLPGLLTLNKEAVQRARLAAGFAKPTAVPDSPRALLSPAVAPVSPALASAGGESASPLSSPSQSPRSPLRRTESRGPTGASSGDTPGMVPAPLPMPKRTRGGAKQGMAAVAAQALAARSSEHAVVRTVEVEVEKRVVEVVTKGLCGAALTKWATDFREAALAPAEARQVLAERWRAVDLNGAADGDDAAATGLLHVALSSVRTLCALLTAANEALAVPAAPPPQPSGSALPKLRGRRNPGRARGTAKRDDAPAARLQMEEEQIPAAPALPPDEIVHEAGPGCVAPLQPKGLPPSSPSADQRRGGGWPGAPRLCTVGPLPRGHPAAGQWGLRARPEAGDDRVAYSSADPRRIPEAPAIPQPAAADTVLRAVGGASAGGIAIRKRPQSPSSPLRGPMGHTLPLLGHAGAVR